MSTSITSYVNPDADGVCTILAYARVARVFRHNEMVPVIFGKADAQTVAIVSFADVSLPTLDQLPPSGSVVLIDTHERAQLPSGFPCDRVVEIVDHHLDGNVADFPNAAVYNEIVGAAATIVGERLRSADEDIDDATEVLLAGAIIANTMNLRAPSTTARDSAMIEWLAGRGCAIDEVRERVIGAIPRAVSLKVQDMFTGDLKRVRIGSVMIGISQQEARGIGTWLMGNDVMAGIVDRLGKVAEPLIVSGVDPEASTTTIVCEHPVLRTVLAETLRVVFRGPVATLDRIALRKTDLVPALLSRAEELSRRMNG